MCFGFASSQWTGQKVSKVSKGKLILTTDETGFSIKTQSCENRPTGLALWTDTTNANLVWHHNYRLCTVYGFSERNSKEKSIFVLFLYASPCKNDCYHALMDKFINIEFDQLKLIRVLKDTRSKFQLTVYVLSFSSLSEQMRPHHFQGKIVDLWFLFCQILCSNTHFTTVTPLQCKLENTPQNKTQSTQSSQHCRLTNTNPN